MNLQSSAVRIVSVCMAIVMFATPLMAQTLENANTVSAATQTAASSDTAMTADVVSAAYADAEAEVNGTMWFVVGCLLGVLGWLIAYVSEPSAPAVRLIGKSSDYVLAYTSAYKEKAKKIQSKKAMNGCIVGTVATVIVYVVIFATAASTVSTTR